MIESTRINKGFIFSFTTSWLINNIPDGWKYCKLWVKRTKDFMFFFGKRGQPGTDQPGTEIVVVDEVFENMTVEYEDDDLDDIADQLREKRILKSPLDIWNKVGDLETRMTKLDTLGEEVEKVEKKLEEVEKMLQQLVEGDPPKKKK